jgi:6-pyruvoyltetrahydropterin/6-carboxytetrahydropterin synthase
MQECVGIFHGHNGEVQVQVSAETLDDQGMVCDFGEIKEVLQTWVDQTLDHRMLLHEKDPLRAALEQAGEPVYILKNNPTAESIARLIYETAQAKGLAVTAVTLWETPNSFATYSPIQTPKSTPMISHSPSTNAVRQTTSPASHKASSFSTR